jgi:hypothetical protein
VLEKVEKGLSRKVSVGEWDLSNAEIIWVMRRTRVLMVTAVSGP